MMEDNNGALNATAVEALSAYQSKVGVPEAQNIISSQQNNNNNNDISSDHLQGILEKSNKLTPQDRDRVLHFFQDRFNPTPDVMIYKMKLHEEKRMEQQQQQEEEGTQPPPSILIKETLYLELDYNTFGFKKTRKVKKK